jgi:Xaa-Pro aminopeptidase
MTPEWDVPRAQSQTWFTDVRGSTEFSKDLVNVMRELKISGKVGVAGITEMAEEVYEAIASVSSIVPAEDIIEDLAAQKTLPELDLAREAARIADIGFQTFLANTRTGITEYELAAEAGYAMRSAGADDIFIMISTEKYNQALHSPLDKRLAVGDVIIFEIAPFVEGQCVQVCRTISLGPPSPVLTAKYDLLLQAFAASLEHIKPGRPAAEMVLIMNEIISAAGYAEYCFPPHMRARGHGFGIGSIAPGAVIDYSTQAVLQPGMILISHPNQYFPETGYLVCGETVLVTPGGIERLLKTETKLYIKKD